MRVFIAYDIPNEIREKIYRNFPKYGGIKYVNPDNMHLTLKFLGEVSQDTINEYVSRISKLNLSKVNAKLNGVGFFPSENFIRVIWVGVDAKFDETLLEALNVSDFVPHITVGRCKRKLTAEEINSFKSINLNEDFLIKSLTIYKSELTPTGPIYSVIRRFDL